MRNRTRQSISSAFTPDDQQGDVCVNSDQLAGQMHLIFTTDLCQPKRIIWLIFPSNIHSPQVGTGSDPLSEMQLPLQLMETKVIKLALQLKISLDYYYFGNA